MASKRKLSKGLFWWLDFVGFFLSALFTDCLNGNCNMLFVWLMQMDYQLHVPVSFTI